MKTARANHPRTDRPCWPAAMATTADSADHKKIQLTSDHIASYPQLDRLTHAGLTQSALRDHGPEVVPCLRLGIELVLGGTCRKTTTLGRMGHAAQLAQLKRNPLSFDRSHRGYRYDSSETELLCEPFFNVEPFFKAPFQTTATNLNDKILDLRRSMMKKAHWSTCKILIVVGIDLPG